MPSLAGKNRRPTVKQPDGCLTGQDAVGRLLRFRLTRNVEPKRSGRAGTRLSHQERNLRLCRRGKKDRPAGAKVSVCCHAQANDCARLLHGGSCSVRLSPRVWSPLVYHEQRRSRRFNQFSTAIGDIPLGGAKAAQHGSPAKRPTLSRRENDSGPAATAYTRLMFSYPTRFAAVIESCAVQRRASHQPCAGRH